MAIDRPVYVFATVIFPLAVPKPYTYKIPEELRTSILIGIRVEVPLRNKLYSALVIALHEEIDLDYRPRYINALIDEIPIISDIQYKFWKWLSSYYCCTQGEVMNVALPAGLKLSSETKIVLDDRVKENFQGLEDDEFLISEALSIQNELTIDEIQGILNKKTVYPVIRALLDRGTIYIKEELIEKFKPKKEKYVRLTPYYAEDRNRLTEALDLCQRSALQTKTILAYTKLSKEQDLVARSDLYELATINKSVLDALVKKEIFDVLEMDISRLDAEEDEKMELKQLSALQVEAVDETRRLWEIHDAVLLHGVTGSGKTRVYMELIQQTLSEGRQVLYLLPEIALTAQIVLRLKAIFGTKVQVYHSRMSNNERVELWKATKSGQSIVLGARSSLFLPFDDLGLIVVDEEHDPSYKQQDPAPRYNARDAAIFLARSYGAKVLLGSATPSLESFLNAHNGKYGKVEMMERFGEVLLPEITIVDLTKERQAKRMTSYFSKKLKDEIDLALINGKQALLFQNRRGYAPSIQCLVCGYTAGCPNCDVTLTYHKFFNELRCHLCGFRAKNHDECPACGNNDFRQIGFGTEKIEDVIGDVFPTATVARLDYDTARSKAAYEKLIHDFQEKKIDILVGTQMVTKGLDFDDIAVVGVLNADLLLFFPDFRASERAFQLLTQVAGRAGRRKEQGRVVIQTSKPSHPVILDTIEYNYHKFVGREAYERKSFRYPPYYRMINILLKHKQPVVVQQASELLAEYLRKSLGKRVMGPAEPGVAKVRGMYLRAINIKLEKDHKLIAFAKKNIIQGKHWVKDHKGLKSVRINIDVDPY
jgi:primosomal protein N' (replication factor Y)